MYKVIIVDSLGENADCIKKMDIWRSREDFEIVQIIKDEKRVLEILANNNIDVVFISANGKEIKDIELIKEIKKNGINICLIIISEFNDYDNIREGFLAGAFDYLVNPITCEYVNSALDRVYEELKSHHMNEEMIDNINTLINSIFIGEDNVVPIIENIINFLYTGVNNYSVSCNVILDEVKEKIYDGIITRYSWLEKFIYMKKFNYKKEFLVKSKKDIIEEWEKDFNQITSLIRKYKILDNKLIYNIGSYAVAHVDEKLTLEEVSRAVFLNKSYVSHIFKRETGISFIEFITDIKIDRAKVLLFDNKKTINEISFLMGYNDAEYFSKIFKMKTGVTPTQYRKEIN